MDDKSIQNEPVWAADRPETSQTRPVNIGHDLVVGGRDVVLMAGPCSVESYEQTRIVAT